MTIMLHLEPETDALLQEEATQTGRDPETAAAALLAGALAEQAALRGVRRGLADGAAGRVTALAAWDAGMRDRHGIPADATPLSGDEFQAFSPAPEGLRALQNLAF